MTLFNRFVSLIESHEKIRRMGSDPFRIGIDEVLSPTEAVIGGRRTLLAGTNNYLGLTFDCGSIAAARKALENLGTGTTGSSIANGSYAGHRALERELARVFGREHGIVFTTGYRANLGIISTVAGPNDFLIIGADCHASIYDACRLGAATVIRARHDHPADLDRRLRRLRGESGNKVIVVEGIYSMLGDQAPLVEIAEVKRRHGAYLIVDEAHSFGVLGASGRGLAQQAGVEDAVDFIVGTFSKSLGAVGGFCVSDHPDFDVLRIACRPYMFTAALPPSIIASVRAALAAIESRPELRARLWRNVETFYNGLRRCGFELGPQKGPIVAVHLPSPELAVQVWEAGRDQAAAASPPWASARGTRRGTMPPVHGRAPALAEDSRTTVRVEPVEGKQQFEWFIRLPDRLYGGRPGYVAPLLTERRQNLTPERNAYFRHASARYWLAYRGGHPVGRISAQVDDLHLARHQDKTGHFGLIDAANDPAVFAALLSTAEDWLRGQGMRRALGPFSLSINAESGLLVDGFEAPPMIMMPYAEPYAAMRLEAHGYRKAKDLIAYTYDGEARPIWGERLLERIGARGRVRVRRLVMRRYRRELAMLLDIFNDAWSDNWGFVPFTEAEGRQLGSVMRPLIHPDLVWIAEVDGEPACMAVCLPNLYEAIAGLDGRLLPTGWLKLLWRLKIAGVRSCRVPLMGVRRAYHRTPLGAALMMAVLQVLRAEARRHGFHRAELSWILEDNQPMRRIIEDFGAYAYKTYRIYEKRLA